MEIETKRKTIEHHIHLPDRLFCRFVQEEFGINKGVYNTIDLWFYNKGLQNLLNRRIMIINFLSNIKEDLHSEGKKMKFGDGGLTIKLTAYWEKVS